MIYDILPINKGSCVDYTLEFSDSEGAIDLTGVEVGVVDGVPAALNGAIITVDDPVNGLAHLHIPNSIVDKLRVGENYLRFYIKSGCTSTTNEIRLIVQ